VDDRSTQMRPCRAVRYIVVVVSLGAPNTRAHQHLVQQYCLLMMIKSMFDESSRSESDERTVCMIFAACMCCVHWLHRRGGQAFAEAVELCIWCASLHRRCARDTCCASSGTRSSASQLPLTRGIAGSRHSDLCFPCMPYAWRVTRDDDDVLVTKGPPLQDCALLLEPVISWATSTALIAQVQVDVNVNRE
jgi:hypothetical protein